jgi:lipoprotein
MNITKYGISEFCGYGIFFMGGCGFRSGFYTNTEICAESQITTRSAQRLEWTPNVLYGLQLDATNDHRIYIVFDSDTGTWKEYFSGMTVNLVTSCYVFFEPQCIVNVDGMLNYCDVLTVSIPRECNATEFAEGVSKYSDKQIKEIVAQLNTLRSSASEWKSKFDAMVKAVKDERAAKEAGLSSVESKLASGFGKYGNNSSGGNQGTSNTQTANPQQEAKPEQPPAQEEKLQWIRQGRCAFCGGEFKGLFSKVCRECGKAKNYR